METFPRGSSVYNTQNIIHLVNTVQWLNDNLREPQIVYLETRTMEGMIESRIRPDQVQVMRMFSTLGLTHSEGTVLHVHGHGHWHHWHDFWDADLGQPFGPRYQMYNEKDGLFIREFTNGYAVYNRRDDNEWVEFDIPTAGVTSEKYDYIHEIPAMDGEIYLKMSITKVAPRHLLTTHWGKLKQNS